MLFDIRQMPALQALRLVFMAQGAACRKLLCLRHSCRFMLRHLDGGKATGKPL
jgi:hypothetical protein